VKVAVPRFGDRVAPCFEHTTTISIFWLSDGRVSRKRDFTLVSNEPLDRVRLLRDQQVDTLICGGMEQRFEDMLEARGIRVVSWVKGPVDDLVAQFVRGELVAGSARLGTAPDTETESAGGRTAEQDQKECGCAPSTEQEPDA
jgi:predicted Fe-Mo cluster-binding NifX family protein